MVTQSRWTAAKDSRTVKPKIVLYNPKAVFYTMPLGVLAVASNLDRERFEVCIIDGRLEADPVARVVEETADALCLGVSVLTGAPIADALAVTRAAKAARPALTTVWGGWHPSLFPLETLDEPSIDLTVKGQGETSFAALADCLERGADPAAIPGVASRQNGRAVLNAAPALLDMDGFRATDYGLIPVERYFALKRARQLDYISSTGCPFRCAFCADPFVYERGWTAIPSQRMAAEIEDLWRRHKFDDLNFQDETFFTHKKRVAEIAGEFLERGLKFTWAATMRADQAARLPEETFALCVESGLRRVLIGVESGAPEMLERIAKDTTVGQIVEAAEMCARHGVDVIFSFIVGFPGERADELAATFGLVKRLRAMSPGFETPIFYYKPYPGSRLSREVACDVPGTLGEWAEFDYVAGAAGPWVSPETHQLVERFKFYNRLAWGPEVAWRRPLRALARWRCRHDNYRLPVEKTAFGWLRREPELS